MTDIVDRRRELAARFGASRVVNGDAANLQQAVRQATDQRGADVVFEMSGSSDAIEQSVDLLRIGGQLVLVGSVFPARSVCLQPERIVRGLLRIDGVHNYAPADLAAAIKFLDEAQHRFPFAEMVDAQFSLDEVNRAVQHAMQPDVVRVAVNPGGKAC